MLRCLQNGDKLLQTSGPEFKREEMLPHTKRRLIQTRHQAFNHKINKGKQGKEGETGCSFISGKFLHSSHNARKDVAHLRDVVYCRKKRSGDRS